MFNNANYNKLVSPVDFIIILALISVAAGLLGSLVGLGGGIVIVPVLTLIFHIDIRLAIGASVLSVIATSSGAAITYIKDGLTNLRTGIFLEVATTIGALSGAFLTTVISGNILYFLFAIVLLYSAFAMMHKRKGREVLKTSTDKLANYLNLHGEYYDSNLKKTIKYKVTHTKLGLGLMYVAGVVSALLGVGSGTLKVPAMDVAMHMPIKASAATSDFMIGVTAAASAGAYFSRGQINPFIAAPVVLGVLVGAMIGSHWLDAINPRYVKLMFLSVLLIVSVEMFFRGLA